MSERHVYECDHCGHVETAYCDGRGHAKSPFGWVQNGDKDYCDQECESADGSTD